MTRKREAERGEGERGGGLGKGAGWGETGKGAGWGEMLDAMWAAGRNHSTSVSTMTASQGWPQGASLEAGCRIPLPLPTGAPVRPTATACYQQQAALWDLP